MTCRTPRRAIVFDLDGTLVDSLPLVLAAIQHAIEPFGGKAARDIFSHLGGPPETFMARLVKDAAHVPEALRRMKAYHHEFFHLIHPYAGSLALLEKLQHQGVQAALWTGRDRASTDTLLHAHGLGNLLAAVVCGDDLPSHKPAPAGLHEIMDRLGCTAAETLFVGDADVDVLGGHACGVDTVLIRHERAIDREILAKSWRVVATPPVAYDLVLACVA